MKQTIQDIIELEKSLLTDEVRTSTEAINNLLHDNFIEFTQSGTSYTKKEALEGLSDSSIIQLEAESFDGRFLGNDLVQITFHSTTRNLEMSSEKHALRSSLWKFEDNRWQMIFHQGTKKKGPQ